MTVEAGTSKWFQSRGAMPDRPDGPHRTQRPTEVLLSAVSAFSVAGGGWHARTLLFFAGALLAGLVAVGVALGVLVVALRGVGGLFGAALLVLGLLGVVRGGAAVLGLELLHRVGVVELRQVGRLDGLRDVD